MDSEVKKFFGSCRFCGQLSAGTIEGADTAEEADEIATMDCSCYGACGYRKKKEQKERAKLNLRELFVEKNERWNSMENEKLIEFLESAIDHVVEQDVNSISLSIPGIGSAKISMNSKSGVVIERRKTVAGKITADK